MLHNQLWYPSLLKILTDYPVLLPPMQSILISPDGQSHPPSAFSLWPHGPSQEIPPLRGTFRGLIRKSWRASTESVYSSAWRQLDSWCPGRGIDPLSAPLKDVLEFLLFQFQTRKQYRTINTLRSAISMTHLELDGYKSVNTPLSRVC